MSKSKSKDTVGVDDLMRAVMTWCIIIAWAVGLPVGKNQALHIDIFPPGVYITQDGTGTEQGPENGHLQELPELRSQRDLLVQMQHQLRVQHGQLVNLKQELRSAKALVGLSDMGPSVLSPDCAGGVLMYDGTAWVVQAQGKSNCDEVPPPPYDDPTSLPHEGKEYPSPLDAMVEDSQKIYDPRNDTAN